jgi:hypothetical protein
MSKYHVLLCSDKDHEIKVAFHIPIPATNNDSSVSFRTALKQYLGTPTSQVPWLAASYAEEVASIGNGEVYEHVESVPVTATISVAQKVAVLDARYAYHVNLSEPGSVINQIRQTLKYWGYNGNPA